MNKLRILIIVLLIGGYIWGWTSTCAMPDEDRPKWEQILYPFPITCDSGEASLPAN